MKRLAIITVFTLTLIFSIVGTASAHTAYRYWSNGTGGQSWGTDDAQAAYSWIQGEAKGSFVDFWGNKEWVVLRDLRIYHNDSNNWRPGAYWNAYDPYGITDSIQYTLQQIGYGVGRDNIYGSNTAYYVYYFQQNNGLATDQRMENHDYAVMSYTGK